MESKKLPCHIPCKTVSNMNSLRLKLLEELAVHSIQPIIALYFESETVLQFYNLEA